MSTPPREIAYPPLEIELHDWWAGVYDHVFVALHPLHRVALHRGGEDDLDAIKTARPVRWDELRRAVGTPPFPTFALALWCAALAANRDDADARLVDRIERTLAANELAAPWEDTVAPILERPLGEAFARLGVGEVTAWDETREVSTMLTPGDLAAAPAIARRIPFFGPFALSAPGILAVTGTEDIATLIALSDEARERVAPEAHLEGFYAPDGTYCDWINPPDFFQRAPRAAK
ncbi:hypothetical protein H0I76_01330 [Limibaculum sp. M0105]|uniref:Uncharacterized protein n=1 Tax=Thermohalobaculum xanthum TaxID=2753746 RepID=A0A8J7M435_9RHOB|nr:hypothetical protein [Thermohalobaculum xanthum]MBK0397818.1 hypothetical protein [Thermohalobaculum xanthum]